MKSLSVTFRGFLVALLMTPYLLVVLGVLSGYVTLCHKPSFQNEVVSSLQDGLSVLTVSASEFEKIKWTDIDKEFEYGGKMYDVAKIERDGTNYLISCENDSLEDLFINWLRSASKSKSKVVSQIQFSEPICELEFSGPGRGVSSLRPVLATFYCSYLSEIIPPPPRVS